MEALELGSPSGLRPGTVRGGDYRFAIVELYMVPQTMLPALVLPVDLRVLMGGTDNPSAPPADFIDGAGTAALAGKIHQQTAVTSGFILPETA